MGLEAGLCSISTAEATASREQSLGGRRGARPSGLECAAHVEQASWGRGRDTGGGIAHSRGGLPFGGAPVMYGVVVGKRESEWRERDRDEDWFAISENSRDPTVI